ncbi:chitin synthase chs-2-like, partial [Clarias magur]
MLWHRVQTFIHFIAYNGTEAEVNRKARKYSEAMLTTFSEENKQGLAYNEIWCGRLSPHSLPLHTATGTATVSVEST